MSKEFTNPDISFQPRNLIRHQGRVLEIDDFTPESLRTFVEDHTDIISGRIERLHEETRMQARNPDAVTRETILIARLALQGSERQALTSQALSNPTRFHDTAYHLRERFIPYWLELNQTLFTPRIRTRGSNTSGTAGVWLGVTLDT